MPQSRVVNPLILALAIASVLVIPAFLGINETLSAAALCLVFFAVTIFQPTNGVTFILLVVPFFLGEPGWPCFWLLDIFIYGLILICAVWAVTSRWKYKFPLKWPVILLVAVSVIGLPLNAKESLYNLWAYSWRETLALLVMWDHDPLFDYLRVLTNTASGACLFIVTHNHFTRVDDKDIKKIFLSLVIMATGVCLAGLFMFYNLVPQYPDRWHYLSLSMVGKHNGAVTAFAYNEQYLVHYLSLTIPLTLYFATREGGRWFHGALYSAALALMAFVALQAGQRAGLISLGITLAMAVPAYIGPARGKGPLPRWVIGLAGILVVVGAGVFFLSRQDVLQRLSPGKILSDPRLTFGWASLRMMAASPALGSGLGSFFSLYDEFKPAQVGFRPINAHSQYFQIVAEQGLFGVAAWGLFLALCVTVAVRAFKKETSPEKKALMAVPAISLTVWLWLGFVNSLFYVRSTGMFFWVFVGLLTAWSAPSLPDIRPGKKTLTAFALMGMMALGYQLWLINGRQVADGFSSGFYNYERVEGGIDGRWASRRAVMTVRVNGKIAVIRLVALLPGLDKKPQKVRVMACGQRQEIAFPDRRWKEITVRTQKPIGSNETFWFEADYSLNPKRAGVSADDRDLAVFIGNVEWK
jgi:O-antigen ligase